jgi:hypothetical protein
LILGCISVFEAERKLFDHRVGKNLASDTLDLKLRFGRIAGQRFLKC